MLAYRWYKDHLEKEEIMDELKATVTRTPSTDKGTFGTWLLPNGSKFPNLERPAGVEYPCIPAGTYQCKLVFSPSFALTDFGYGKGMVYGVEGVPGRSHILIHPANFAVEIKTATDPHHLQLKGCLAPGTVVCDVMVPEPDGRMIRGVAGSVAAVKALMKAFDGKPFTLTIQDAA